MEWITKAIESVAILYGIIRFFQWWIRKARLEVKLAKLEYKMQHKHIVSRIRQ